MFLRNLTYEAQTPYSFRGIAKHQKPNKKSALYALLVASFNWRFSEYKQ